MFVVLRREGGRKVDNDGEELTRLGMKRYVGGLSRTQHR